MLEILENRQGERTIGMGEKRACVNERAFQMIGVNQAFSLNLKCTQIHASTHAHSRIGARKWLSIQKKFIKFESLNEWGESCDVTDYDDTKLLSSICMCARAAF